MTEDLHALSGAYAVHALPDADEVLFEGHLAECATCGPEVRLLRETAARLAVAVAEQPPAALRPRVLAAVHRVRRAAFGRPVRAPGPFPEAISARPKAGGPSGPGLAPPRRWHAKARAGRWRANAREGRWRAKALAGLVAVSTAAAVAFGVVAFDARRDLGDLRTRDAETSAALSAVLAAPDARTVRQRVASGGTGVAVLSRGQGRMVFTSSGLPELPPSKVYVLWLMGPDGMRPVGALDRRPDGLTTPVLARLQNDGHVGLTVEPAGGSERPTTRPILFAELPAA
ncbi:anti-sigma factor [Nonomuraea cavernae]|uniref:anti-sigma factor n=1 Tax=Nonomuraea cavernae TaxID=2045107 RepID=UPI003400431F